MCVYKVLLYDIDQRNVTIKQIDLDFDLDFDLVCWKSNLEVRVTTKKKRDNQSS